MSRGRKIKLLIRKIHFGYDLAINLGFASYELEAWTLRDYSELREREPWNPLLPARNIVRDIVIDALEPQRAAFMKTEKKEN